MQSDRDSFCGEVVFDSVNIKSWVEDLNAVITLSKTTSLQKLFRSDCITLTWREVYYSEYKEKGTTVCVNENLKQPWLYRKPKISA